MADLIQSLWIGPRLTTMEQLTIRSFLEHGHEFRLYVYDRVDGVPEGTVVCDGNEVLPRSRIFTYREHDSVSGFSNCALTAEASRLNAFTSPSRVAFRVLSKVRWK